MVVDSVVESGLRAAGASENTIKGARLAAAVVSVILAKRRMSKGQAEALGSTPSKRNPDTPESSASSHPPEQSRQGEPHPNQKPFSDAHNADDALSKPARLISSVPESYINRRYVIDMTAAPPGSKTNAAGFPRNGPWFWRKLLQAHPEMFSDVNRRAIGKSRAPSVDELWVKYNPEHSSFAGDKLIHHHIDQGSTASAIPELIHFEWYKSLHPNR
jgi:hypothetical protein